MHTHYAKLMSRKPLQKLALEQPEEKTKKWKNTAICQAITILSPPIWHFWSSRHQVNETNCDANISFEKLLRWPCKLANLKIRITCSQTLIYTERVWQKYGLLWMYLSASTAFLSRIHLTFGTKALRTKCVSPRQTSYLYKCLINNFICF